MKRFLLYLLVVATIVACSKSEEEGSGNSQPTPEKPKTEIKLDTSVSDFTSAGGIDEISFMTTEAWTAEIINSRADGWCSIDPTSGAAGSATITVTTEPNDTPDDRSASIVIKAGSASKTIKVSQKQKDALTVTASSFEVGAEGGEVKIEVKANINFDYAIEESAKEWVKYEGTRAMKTSTLTFSVAENDDIEKREAKIYITSGSFSEEITIYQAGSEPSIVISKNEYVVSADGETIAVEVKSNVDVSIELPTDADWVAENTTRGISTNTYYFDIAPSEEYDQRSAEIMFTNSENGLSELVKVVQTQKDALVVAKDSYTVESDGGQIQIEVGHNVDFDVKISADWITREQTRAFISETLTFNIAKNPTHDNREGTIIFKSKDGRLSQTVKVYQAQEDALIISKKDIVVDAESGSVSFEIQTNIEFKVSEPNASWLRAVQTRGLTSHTLTYEYDANTTYDPREAQITVTDTKNNKSETITITQAQRDAIVLAKSEYEFGLNGGNLDFEIQTNVDISVTISDDAKDWIYHVETRALETKTLSFRVLSCSTDEDREGVITISGGNATQNITVKQSGLKEILEKEREALIAFYNATGGDNWTNNENWCSDKPIKEWYGVNTNYLGLVNLIELQYNNLDGNIPDQIGEFQYLNTLWLTGNNLKGELPLSMTKLTKLSWLLLQENQLSGKVSHIISQLPYLNLLALSDNNFTGELPEVNDSMTCYSLNNNLFTGSIPESHIKAFERNSNGGIYNTDYGWRYDITGNNLTGKVPDSMVNHKNWVAHWRDILPQNPGYGFEKVDIPAPQIVVKCFDDSLLDLAEEYKSNQYTIVFRWDPYCYWSHLYVEPIYKLYNKYKDEGLGLVCTTHLKYAMDEISPLTSAYNDIKVFWEVTAGQGYADNSWDNNPIGLGSWFFLFRTGVTPYFHIIDNNGNIVFYGSGDGGNETVPQYHDNSDDIYDFVANLFGDEKYEEEKDYESTDYSRDGEVKTLQRATKGDGIDIVLMGDGYSDRLIADESYDKVMNTAMEKFFMEEPYKSYRDHFNVYSVTAVSKNEVYTDTSETAFAGYFGAETLVGGNDSRVFSYAQKAIGDKRIDEAIIVVMMNSTNYAGTCYMYHSSADTGDYSNGVSISYFPVGIDDNALAQVLHHEAAGHGFSKLADEYAYEYMGEIPESEIIARKSYEQYGWYKNADFTNDPTKVKWSHFLSDTRYANDGLGVFEGAFTYWTGVWRPTENSIMRHNTGGFNAPSREAIYYRIHKLAYGADWEYDYEEFVEWDAKNRKATAAATRGVPYRLDIPKDFKPLHAPVVMNTSWRNAKNNAPAKKLVTPSGNTGNAGRNLQKVSTPSTETAPKSMTATKTIALPDGTTKTSYRNGTMK